ncbi:MAG: hypothetical protein M1816_003176 [Peltula sp. TS41687]|nr:MAG: hypothetical protein M1816_003176 [Peltula sp. TS41687]
MAFSSLAVTILATTAAAIPASLSSSSHYNLTYMPLQYSPPTTFLTLDQLNQRGLRVPKDLPAAGYPTPRWSNGTFFRDNKKLLNSTLDLDLKRKTTCLHDPSYVAGGAVWLKYSADFCTDIIPNGAGSLELTHKWIVEEADLSDYPGWYKLYFGIQQDPYNEANGVSITQADCVEGFRKIVRYAVESWDCQGYSGHNWGDQMGSFGGGGTGDNAGENPKYFMWVGRPDWPWEGAGLTATDG